MRILIADDNELALTIVSETLAAAGYEVVACTNGEEALGVVRRGTCRIVICDWEMPGMSGPELCTAIRSEDLDGYVYVILLTAHQEASKRVDGLTAGADDFVTKPFDPKELVARVRTGERVLSLETRDVAIFALAKLAESRDPDTGAHLERVCGYARILAQELSGMAGFRDEIDAEYIRLVYQTAPLHDIGKVGIPDRVLLKPGRLVASEIEVMKTHTTIGSETLDAALRKFPSVKFLRMGRDIARTHHERYDGTGYPAGLRGTAIPLCGRIMAVADVYDALTSKRVYKEAFTHDAARSIIMEESGRQFDPGVVEAFVRCEERFLSVKARLGDAAVAAVAAAA
jgi:putative two-component system response regulator